MSWNLLVGVAVAGLIIVWLALAIACVFPDEEETLHLDPLPLETTLTVRSPWQFAGDADNGDWIFCEEWEDGTEHTLRIHFTTLSAQGTVSDWVWDALTAKADAFRREMSG